ncbi:MAG: response regulator [Pseudomonadota bacterium]|nr:response regulator [Pseudomonadota bacterium]
MDTEKTILIVDDDDLVLESIDLLLSAVDDFQTIRAHGSAGAMSHIHHTRHIDVIVADVILSGELSGIDVCRAAIAQRPDVAVVIITADTEVTRADIPTRGVFLRKPCGGPQLVAAVADALSRVNASSVE